MAVVWPTVDAWAAGVSTAAPLSARPEMPRTTPVRMFFRMSPPIWVFDRDEILRNSLHLAEKRLSRTISGKYLQISKKKQDYIKAITSYKSDV
ncbi:hypothetical protein Acsp04_43590 [Actinomadura sp. NBRC 104425]|nr:hypothetical protein Acsp04_43590 [Actinomadura sp. NBRC 104425]